MRWKYASHDPAAASAKQERIRKIERWWQDFESFATDWQKTASDVNQIVQWMSDHLADVDERIRWEYFPANGNHGLSLTPEVDRQLRPMVETMVQMAPRIAGWEFHPYRIPHPTDDMLKMTKSRTGQDVAKTSILLEQGHDNRINLRFKGTKSTDACFILCEGILGEQNLDQWVGDIEADDSLISGALKALFGVSSLVSSSAKATNVENFRSQFETEKQRVLATLEKTPLHEMSEPPAIVFMGSKQSPIRTPGRENILVGSGSYTSELIQGINSGAFASSRFSNFGESFCYLKLSGSETLPTTAAERADIEDPLDALLREQRLGCVLGGASSASHAFIDLALADVDKAIPVIRKVLSNFDLKKESWLLFPDQDLIGEWIGVFPDSPSPQHVRS